MTTMHHHHPHPCHHGGWTLMRRMTLARRVIGMALVGYAALMLTMMMTGEGRMDASLTPLVSSSSPNLVPPSSLSAVSPPTRHGDGVTTPTAVTTTVPPPPPTSTANDTTTTTTSPMTEAEFLQRLVAWRGPYVQAVERCLHEYVEESASAMTWFSLSTPSHDDDGYDILRTTWNQRNAARQYPDVIVLPRNATDAAAVVTCVRRTGHHRVCARNGKASYEGDTCTNGVVVDVSQLKTVQRLSSSSGGRVRFGAGLTVGRVAVELEKMRLVLPLSSGSAVGITGLTLVGGHGMLARHLGLTTDFVTAVEVVTDRGRVLTATAENEYSDYLWMARGGGSGVQHYPGIITAVQVDHLPSHETTARAPHAYTHHQIWFPATVENAVRVLRDWQAFLVDPVVRAHPLYDRLSVEPWLFLYGRHVGEEVRYQKQLYISAYFYGNDTLHARYERELLPRVLRLGPEGQGNVRQEKRYGFLDFYRMLSGTKNAQQLASGQHGYDLHEQGDGLNRWKGYSSVSGTGNVSAEAFRSLATHIYDSQPMTRRYFEGKPLGGAMGRVSKNATAFWHRDAVWWGLYNNFYHSQDSVDRVRDILDTSRNFHNRFLATMGSSEDAGCYAGYIDHDENPTVEGMLRRYYGDNGPRLAQIKRHRDPDNLFAIHVPTRDELESLIAANTKTE